MKNELTTTDAMIKKTKRQFNKINNQLAQISQDESDFAKRKAELTAKKKELTKSIDKELKEIKDSMKQLSDDRIFTLGERNARLVDLKQLGMESELKDQEQNAPVDIRNYNQKVLQN